MNNEKRIFTSGLDFNKLFIIFVIGCLFGNYYEMILNLLRHYLRDGVNADAIYNGQRSVNPNQRVFLLTRSGFGVGGDAAGDNGNADAF